VWNQTRAAEFQWDPRVQEPVSTFEESDGKGPAFTQPIAFENEQQPATFTQPRAFENEQQPATFTQPIVFENEQQPATFTQPIAFENKQPPVISAQSKRLSRSGKKRGERAVRAKECGGIRGRAK
jgi:hypothetical protein